MQVIFCSTHMQAKMGDTSQGKQVTLTNPVFLHVPSKAEIVMWTIGIIVH